MLSALQNQIMKAMGQKKDGEKNQRTRGNALQTSKEGGTKPSASLSLNTKS